MGINRHISAVFIFLLCLMYAGGAQAVITLSPTEIKANNLIVKRTPYIDVRAYGAKGDGTTDDTAAIQAAINAMTNGGTLLFPAGTYKVTGTLYLTSSTNLITYHIKGTGKGTLIKPTGFTSGYLFKLNEDSGGFKVVSWPRHPRAIFEDIYVNATDSTSVSFLWYNQASFQFKNVFLEYLLYGAYGTGYTDVVKMEAVTWANPRSSGWLYRQGGMGDGFEGRQLFSGGSEIGNNMVWLYRAHGGSIVDSIGGYYKFEESANIAVRDGHFEEMTTTEGNHIFTIINSSVVLENNFIQSDFSTYDSVYVDDVDATKQDTLLVLRANSFVKNLNNGGSLAVRDIRINNLKPNSKIVLENNRGLLFNVDVSDMSPWDYYQHGIRIRSFIGALDTALLETLPLFTGSAVIESIQGSWKVHPVGSLNVPLRAFSAPTIDVISQVASPASNFTNGTYYYRVEVVDAFYRYSAASAESFIAQTGTNSIKLEVTAAPNSVVRVMRGTSAGVYDRYVDIPVYGDKVIIFDTGSRVQQYVWTVSAYSHHTTGITFAGVHNILTGLKTLYGTAAPTAGAWVQGDRFITPAPAEAGGAGSKYITNGWACTVAGSPGTWLEQRTLTGN